MAKCELEFFDCTGRALFAPINETAQALCKNMRRKNLTESEVEFYASQGYEIEIRPRITFKDSLRRFMV